MDMKLCGICFKLRGGPDLLDYVQSNTAIPVDVMGQVMEQMASVTPDELEFAKKLDTDWKKAIVEKVPLVMTMADDGGYDITCTVPDELMAAVRLVTGLENEKIIEEYAASHLKNVCGIDADILSVDSVKENEPAVAKAAPVPVQAAQGFDLSDLGEEPEGPAFEDVAEFSGMAMDIPIPAMETAAEKETVKEAEPVKEPEQAAEPEEDGFFEDTGFEEEQAFGEQEAEEGSGYIEEGIPLEEGYPESEEFFGGEAPEEEGFAEDEAPAEEETATDEENEMNSAVSGIYKELVGNIRDRKLDERLGLKIGQ